jgi:tRNA-uridine 2-sulfurtransferase
MTTMTDPILSPTPNDRRRIVVAMSGGVDSSVVAGLLKRAGHDVIGITLQLYDHGQATARSGSCCAGQDIHDARRVAAHLDIPHYVLDYEQRFKASVMQSFADSYVNGETPIPCVTCNSTVKFSELLSTAKELGADLLATGHYIRMERDDRGIRLYRAIDSSRDQSYFLFNTTRAQLRDIVFPLGGFSKPQVRGFAEELGLAIADKPDSQDICFVPSGKYADVIERLRPGAAEPGDIVHLDGRILGQHKGIVNFTVGQRKGLGIASADPLFVVRLDGNRREVVVGPKSALETSRLELRDMNWLADDSIESWAVDGREVWARVRSSHNPEPAFLHLENGRVDVRLVTGIHGISPGQACVLYADGGPTARMLGGGWIARTRAPRSSRPEQPISEQPRAIAMRTDT